MNKNNLKVATVEAMLYEYYTGQDGKHPVKIRVTWQRKPKYFPVIMNGEKLFLTPQEWADVFQGKKLSKEQGAIKQAIQKEEVNARRAKNKITDHDERPFIWSKFLKEYVNKESDRGFIAAWEESLKQLKKENRIGTFKAYRNALSAFKRYRHDKDLMPEDVTVDELRKFEEYLSKEKVVKLKSKKTRVRTASRTTIAMYMRALKAALNNLISENPSLAETYPFATKQSDKKKYKIRQGSGHKGEALSVAELQTLINSKPPETSPELEAVLYWLFSFYCQGMNFRDIFHLRYENIQADAIRYVRRKTQDTEAHEEQIEIPLSSEIEEIIVKLGNNEKQPKAYVFPLLSGIKDPLKQDDVIRQKIKTTNKWLKVWCAEIGLPPVTTYWSRHSYASLLKASGESVEMIRELLGHSDVKTTEAYLKRFDIDKKKAVNDRVKATLKVA